MSHMARCSQCGKNFIRSWGQMLSTSEKFNTCQECLRANEQIKREARLQEEGRMQAQRRAEIDEFNRQQIRKNLKNLRRSFGLR